MKLEDIDKEIEAVEAEIKCKRESLEAEFKAELEDGIKGDAGKVDDYLANVAVGDDTVGTEEFDSRITRRFTEGSAVTRLVSDDLLYKTNDGRPMTLGGIVNSKEGEEKAEGDEGTEDDSSPYQARTLTVSAFGSLVIPVTYEFIEDAEMNVTDEVTRLGLSRCHQKFDSYVGTNLLADMGGSNALTINTSSITYGDLSDAYHSIKPQYRTNVKWFLNDTDFKNIRKQTGAVDTKTPIWDRWVNGGIGLDNIVTSDQIPQGILYVGNFDEALAVRVVTKPVVIIAKKGYGYDYQIVFRAGYVVRNPDALIGVDVDS